MSDANQSMTDNATPFAPVASRAPTPEELAAIRRVWGAGDVYACDEKGAAAAYEDVPLLLGEIDRLTADRDAWRDALQHVACRLGGTGAGSPDDVRLACDDLIAQDDDLLSDARDEIARLRAQYDHVLRCSGAEGSARIDAEVERDDLHAEVTRLRAALDDVAHAHERDLMRLARALGFDHEPPSNVDAMVGVAESLTAMRPAVDEALATVNETKASLGAAIAKVERLRAERNDIREGVRYVGASVDRVITLDGVELVSALARDTSRRDLDAVRRVLAEGLGADARESDLDALALAARACETIDCLRAQVTSITTAVDALTSTERDDDRADAAQMRAGWRALSAENDALVRGESAPSLDAIRAWEEHGGRWLCVRTPHLRGATVGLRAGLAGGVVVLDGDIGCSYDDHAEFAWHHEGARFWRVADDGSLAVAEASS